MLSWPLLLLLYQLRSGACVRCASCVSPTLLPAVQLVPTHCLDWRRPARPGCFALKVIRIVRRDGGYAWYIPTSLLHRSMSAGLGRSLRNSMSRGAKEAATEARKTKKEEGIEASVLRVGVRFRHLSHHASPIPRHLLGSAHGPLQGLPPIRKGSVAHNRKGA